MRIYLSAAILLGLLAGCSADQGSSTSKATASASSALQQGATSRFAARSAMKGFASLPDRGELLAYNQTRDVKHSGAYTAYPVALSEAHALDAMRTGEMVVKAPNGELIRLKYERHIEHPDGNWTWIGRNADGADAVLTFGEKAVFGTIPQGVADTLRLTMRAGQSFLVATDRSKLAGLDGSVRRSGTDQLIPPRLAAATSGRTTASMQAEATGTQSASAASTALVDVLLGYTNGFSTQLGGDSQAITRLVNMTDITNQAYVNSGVTMRVRLVGTLKVTYPDNTDNGDALEKLTGYKSGTGGGPITPDPAFSALRAKRDELGADLVSLVRAFRTPENNGCGIAWLIGGGSYAIETADAPFGYSVVSDGTDLNEGDNKTYFCREETLAHELGHNMGQAHNTEDSSSTGTHPYSYGYRESTTGGFYTVMAYPKKDANQFAIRYFANPSVQYSGRPTGIADQSDNVRSMNLSMPIVSGFRATVIPVPGTLKLNAIFKMGNSGKTEVFSMGGADNFKSFTASIATGLYRTATDSSWAFQFGDFNGDGIPDLYSIFKMGASNTTEVFVLNGADNFSTFLYGGTTSLGRTGTDSQWVFKLGDYNKDGKLDLYAIQRMGASGRTEVHVLNGADNFKSFLAHIATALGATGSGDDWKFNLGDWNADGKLDVFVIYKTGASNKTEVHILDGANNFQSYLLNRATVLYPTGTNNAWDFKVGDANGDGKLDIYAIFKQSSSGKTDIFVMNGSDQFQTYLFGTQSALYSTGSDHSWEFELVPE